MFILDSLFSGLLSLPSQTPVAKAPASGGFLCLVDIPFLPRSSLSSPFRVCREVTGLQEILASFFMNLQNSENRGKQVFLVSLLTGELVPQVIGLTLNQLSTRLRFDSIRLPSD